MTPDEILQQLRTARANTGLSYQQLADMHGSNAPTVRSHETGERAMTVAVLVEHASWFGLEVVVRPAGSQGADAYQRGYDQCRGQVAGLLGLAVPADGPSPAPVDWDKALDDAYGEIAQEPTDA